MKDVLWIGLMPPGKGAPYLRKSFAIEQLPRQVKCRVSGLGFYELYLNGQRVGDGRLDPLFTRYDVRTCYREFDVTDYLHSGENICEIHLGYGWYAGNYSDVYGSNFASYRHICKAALRLFAGKTTLLETSENWEAASGPVLHDSPRSGETFDARILNDLQWVPASRLMPPGGKLCLQSSAPVTIQNVIEPVAVMPEKNGTVCYDFGVNLTGTIKLAVKGKSGSQVILRYGELFDKENGFSQNNINWYVDKENFQTDRYILRGDEHGECYTPSFSYHGFRYAQVTVEGDAEIISLQALSLRSNFPRRGNLNSSNSDFNHLLEITERSLTSNFTGFPSDCPHREKNGWLADAHLAADSMLAWYDAVQHYADFVDMIFDYQRPSGQLPGMVPGSGFGWHWDFGPVWSVAPILLAHKCYMYNGSLQIIKKHFSKMARYLEFCLPLQRNGFIDIGPAEWKLPDSNTIIPPGLVDTALICRCAEIMAQFAGLLNKTAQQLYYTDLAEKLCGKLNSADAQHPSELGLLLACGFGSQQDADQLDSLIRNDFYRANFGIVGAKYVPRALAEYGYINTAFRMFTQHQYPGWQWMLDHGATTLWENWQGNESQNHPMLGDVAAWAVRYLAGIKLLEAAFRKFEFAPQIPDDLDSFSWEHQLPGGVLKSSWRKLSGGKVEYQLMIPAGSEALITDAENKVQLLTAGEYTFVK